MKRLGMWNRLALVVGLLLAFGIPTWESYQQTVRANKLAEVGREACLKNEYYVPTNGKSQFDYCWDFWREMTEPAKPTLDDWGIMVTGTAVAVLLIYGLLWLIIATAKWIWRGRQAV